MRTSQTPDGVLHSAAPGLQEMDARNGDETKAVDGQTKAIIGSEYPQAVCELLRRAKWSIDICAYVWKWYAHRGGCAMQKINYAVIEKARNGVKIRVRLNSESKDHYLTKENTRTSQALRRYPIQVKFDSSGTVSHLKMIIIDNEIVIIGSHNLSARSVSENNEASVAIFGAAACKPYKEYFDLLWTNQ